MTRVETLLSNIREKVSDPNKTKWSDDYLINLLNNATLVLATEGDLLREKVDINIYTNKNTYTLPDNFLKLLRVLNSDKQALVFYSHEEADLKFNEKDWEATENSPVTAIIYDKANFREFKVYPIPDLDEVMTEFQSTTTLEFLETTLDGDFGVVTDSELSVDEVDTYGVVTNVEYTNENDEVSTAELDSDYGITTLIEDTGYEYSESDSILGIIAEVDDYNVDTYGVLSDVETDEEDVETVFENDNLYGIGLEIIDDSSEILNLYYTRKPNILSSIYDELEIPEIYNLALEYWVTSNCLMDEKDVQNMEAGRNFYNSYLQEFYRLQQNKPQDYISKGTQYKPTYVNALRG